MKVVLLHAFPLDERMWQPQLDVLSDYETFAPRLYGLGSSIDEWAQAVLAEAKGPLVVVGASMGGYCALAMARHEPNRVRGLLLAGSRADADSRERRRQRDEVIGALRERGCRAGAGRASRSLQGRRPSALPRAAGALQRPAARASRPLRLAPDA